jgi:hypothetical protein
VEVFSIAAGCSYRQLAINHPSSCLFDLFSLNGHVATLMPEKNFSYNSLCYSALVAGVRRMPF